ncbi:MAG: hypothetical protein BLITH_0323 [Brockia lithotrophica]|uniref:Prepilin-type N-terminal cleavage/methylation domain-containing protein n=1 Tax=Brockia lithotrophica TaxID=933949 RepID=A0A2T5GAN2_9BACL|nr:prepilin-type N-terminal cleavage/methylation domain-containing protein [Brockia lithotrophica]PTQ53243.1 MAG: hypothetical protein BLITH_0323 [Brockia lithotrophica]
MFERHLRKPETGLRYVGMHTVGRPKEPAPGFSLVEVLVALGLVALLAVVGFELLAGAARLTALREEREGAYRLARAIGDMYRHLPAQETSREAQNFVATGCGGSPEFSPLPAARKDEFPGELLGTYVPCIRYVPTSEGYTLLVVRVHGLHTEAEERVFLPAASPGVGTR